eukprot:jgi/Ulvmu1/7730/UM039_0036.1
MILSRRSSTLWLLLQSLICLIYGSDVLWALNDEHRQAEDTGSTPVLVLLDAYVATPDGSPVYPDMRTGQRAALDPYDNTLVPLPFNGTSRVDPAADAVWLSGAGPLPLCSTRTPGRCAPDNSVTEIRAWATNVILEGFDAEQHEVRLELAAHPDWLFALFSEPESTFTVGGGDITNSTEVETGGAGGYRLFSVAVAVTRCDAAPCGMFVRLDESAVADAPGAEVALGVWSASLRFWLWPQARGERPGVRAGVADVAYARDGRWQFDVITFQFQDELFVAGQSAQRSVLETEGDFAAAAIIRSPPDPITEAPPLALSTTVQVVIARRCSRGDVVRVTLPEGALRDSAGAALAPAVSAESVCHGDSLQDVRSVHYLLTAVGAVLALAVLAGAVATGALLWRVAKEGDGHHGALQVGGGTLALLLLGQRLALYSLPTLCSGVGCSEPGLALSHWALAGTATTPLPAPIHLAYSNALFPSVLSGKATDDAAVLDVYRVSMEAIPGENGLQRCDAATEICGHRWLGSTGPAITASADGGVQRVYASLPLDSQGVLVGMDSEEAASDAPASAPALVDTVLVEEESGDAEAWRLALAGVALAIITLLAVLAALWTVRTLDVLRVSHSTSDNSDSLSDSSDETKTGGAAARYAWALHPWAVQLAACSPLVPLAAAAGVTAASVSTGDRISTAGAAVAGMTAAATGVALLGTLAVLLYSWWLQPKAGAARSGAASPPPPSMETVSAVPSSIPVEDLARALELDERLTEQQAAESLTAAAMRASMVLQQVNPNPGRGSQLPRSTATADGSSSLFVTNLELSRFFDGGDGGHLVSVAVPAHGGGVVADGAQLVSPREPLRVRTQMDPAMRVAENLSAANLRFVELLRDKYLLSQLQATSLRAANIVALREKVVPADSADGEICKASLKALQVLLEKSAPSASPLLRRLPKDQPGYVKVSTLLTFLTHPTAGAASSMASSFLDTNDFKALDPRSSHAAAAAPHLPSRCHLSGALAGSMRSELSGDLRTSEVLFALDTGSEIVPALSSFHMSERTNEITMTDSAALSGAAGGSMPVSAYRDRMSASQIPEGQGDASAPSSLMGPSSATSAPTGTIPTSRGAQGPPSGMSAPAVTLEGSRRQRPPAGPPSDPRIPPLPLHGLGRLNVPQPSAGPGASGHGKRGRAVGSSGFSRSVRSSPRSSQLRLPSPRSDAISYSSMPHSDSRYGSWRASDSMSGGWRAAVIYDAVSTPGTGQPETTPCSIYVTAQSPPVSNIVDEPSSQASETLDTILRMTAARHAAQPGTPRTSAPVGASATAAAAAVSGMSPPGSIASSALPPTAALPSTPASGLTGGLSGLSGLTVFETALAGEEFYEREGYYPASPGRTVTRTGSFRHAFSRSSHQHSPTGVRNSSEHRYSANGPDSTGTADAPHAAADAASRSPPNPGPEGSAGSLTPSGHQGTGTYAQALMLPTRDGSVRSTDTAAAQEAATIMHASTNTTTPPGMAEAQPEESAALSRPDTESSADEGGGPEVPTQAGADTDASTSAPAVIPEMSFLSRAPEESDNLPPTHASFILPSRFSRDLSRSSDSRLRARMVTAEEQVELNPDTAALQPPMAGGSLPRIGNRGTAGGAHSSVALGEGDVTDWARSQSTSDHPGDSEALPLAAGDGPGHRHGVGRPGHDDVADKTGAPLTAEERHFSWWTLEYLGNAGHGQSHMRGSTHTTLPSVAAASSACSPSDASKNGSRTDLARLALHDSLAAHTEHSERVPATASTTTSASPTCPSKAASAAATVRILTREEWQDLRQMAPPPHSPARAGDTPDASTAGLTDESASRPPPEAAAPPAQAYGAIDRMHARGVRQGPRIQACLNSAGPKGPCSDGGLARTQHLSLTNSKAGGSGGVTRGAEASYSSTLHLSNPTQSSLSTVQTLSNIPQLHPDHDGGISSVTMIGREPYRMHHIGVPIMEPSPVAGHSPTIISRRAADIFRWNAKDSLTVTTPVATTTSAPASVGAELDWPAGATCSRQPQAVAEGLEESDAESSDEEGSQPPASPAAASPVATAPAASLQVATPLTAAPPVAASSVTDSNEGGPTADADATALGPSPPPSSQREVPAQAPRSGSPSCETPADPPASAADTPAVPAHSDYGSVADAASHTATSSDSRTLSDSASSAPPSSQAASQAASHRSALLVAQPHPDSLPPPSGSFSPRVVVTKAKAVTPPSTTPGGRSVADDSAHQVEVVSDAPRRSAWQRLMPASRRNPRALTLTASQGKRSRCSTCCVCFARRGEDPHHGSALVCDALRTALLAFLVPVFSWPVLLVLALALVAVLAHLAIVLCVLQTPHAAHFATLAAETAALGFALVWAALNPAEDDEAWCATLPCTLPLALLWTAAAAAALAHLVRCMLREGSAWWRARSASTASSSTTASVAASMPSRKAAQTQLAVHAPNVVTPATRASASGDAAARPPSGHSDAQHGPMSSAFSAGHASEVTLAVPSGALPLRPMPHLPATTSPNADAPEPPEATGTCTEGLSPMTAYSGSRGPPTPLTDRPMANQLTPGAYAGSAAKPPVPVDTAGLVLSARRTNTASSSTGQERQASSVGVQDSAMNSLSDAGMDRSSAVGSDAASYSIPFPATMPNAATAGPAFTPQDSFVDAKEA